MFSTISFPRSLVTAILLFAAFQWGCTVPLGPGFAHASRQIDVGASIDRASGVSVQVTDKLVNAGDRDLAHLDMNLPAGVSQASGHLKVSVDGRDAALSPASADGGAPVRVSFEPSWPRRQSRTIVTGYELPPQFSSAGIVGATASGFYVVDRTAFPIWLPPFGIFATAARYARTRSMEVTIPAGFRVLAAGSAGRTTHQGTLLRREFRWSKPNEPAYVIAGRYSEQRVAASSRPVLFWTFEPLDLATAQAAASRLASTAATYERVFGRLSKRVEPLYVIEVDAAAISSSSGETYDGISAASFPSGVLLDRRALERGLNSEPVLEAAEYEMARIWFGWRAQPDSAARILLGRGISLFAVVLAAEARGGAAARQEQVARLLGAYDQARLEAPDGPLLNVATDVAENRQTTDAYRAALFFVALEDRAGRDHFGAALRRFWTDMADQELAVDELRSALEAATGSDLAEVFRNWLNRPGIPEDFRNRYAGQSQAAGQGSF